MKRIRNLDEFDSLNVRGVPIKAWEIAQLQDQLGAQLFDECMFDQPIHQIACANIVRELDHKLYRWQRANQTHDLPGSIDIGDPAWRYIPVRLFPDDGQVIVMPTRAAPAGRVAWFRSKKQWRVSNGRQN